MASPRSKSRWAYVVLAFIQAALTAGVIFGWPELSKIFVNQGVYADNCAPDDKVRPCTAQLLYFERVFTAGVFANNAAPLLTGLFLDKFGPKFTSLASVFLFMIGCGLFAVANPTAYLAAFALLGFSGPGIYVSIMHLNNLFPGHQATVLSFFSGTFTVSNFVFKVFRMMSEQKPWFDLAHLFVCYIGLLAPFFLVGAIFWPNKPFTINIAKHDDEANQRAPLIEKGDNRRLYGADLKTQISAPEFWLIVAWMAVTNLHISFYLGTVSIQYSASYANIFTWIWEFGFVAIPLFGYILDTRGIIFAIFLSNTGLFIFSVINAIPVDEIQYVSFVLVSTVNVGIWGIFYTFLSKTFGFNNYGKLLGVACITIALVGLAQYGLTAIAIKLLDKSFLGVNIFLVIMQAAVFATPFFLWKREKQQVQKRVDSTSINFQANQDK